VRVMITSWNLMLRRAVIDNDGTDDKNGMKEVITARAI
jgi:hypothetical protein